MPDVGSPGRANQLPPARVNPVTMVLVGLGAWLAALLVVLLLNARTGRFGETFHICLAGLALGLVGLVWALILRRRARLEAPGATNGRTSR